MSIRRVLYALALSYCTLAAAGIASSDQAMHPLAAVAQKYGYVYMQRTPENAVELVQSGVDVIIRPGSRVWWVNGTPDSTDVVPTYRNRDVYVSDATVRELARIARSSPMKWSMNADPAPKDPSGSGPLTVSAVGGLGAETLNVFGTAAPNALVHIALFAQISRDLPNVFLNGSYALASGDGKYAASVPIGPNYYHDSIVMIDVSVGSGQTASTTYVVGPPNPNLNAPWADSVKDP